MYFAFSKPDDSWQIWNKRFNMSIIFLTIKMPIVLQCFHPDVLKVFCKNAPHQFVGQGNTECTAMFQRFSSIIYQ